MAQSNTTKMKLPNAMMELSVASGNQVIMVCIIYKNMLACSTGVKLGTLIKIVFTTKLQFNIYTSLEMQHKSYRTRVKGVSQNLSMVR